MKDLKSLIAKYERGGPRYTSYPTAPYFSPETDKKRLIEAALLRSEPLSLYIHIPFCKTLCLFCGCTSSVCREASEVDDYLSSLTAELELWRDAGLTKRILKQIQIGGGTPNFLTPEQTLRLGKIIDKYFVRDASDCEFSAEFDPRTLTLEKVKAWRKIGVNRASIGVQDTNPQTQKAINRIQPQEMNIAAVSWFRDSGIKQVNVDIIYGLPFQTQETFAQTLSDINGLSPSRIALFGYAHVPWVKSAQKALEKFPIPSGEEKVELFLAAKSEFEKLGFEFIGLDHFAKSGDALLEARKNGTLHRNFQGYTTHAELDAFSIGLTSISSTKLTYRQNFKSMQDYKASIKSGLLPVERGIILDGEDLLRRGIIMDVMCSLNVEFDRYGVDFKAKFSDAFPALREMEGDGLLELRSDGFSVTPLGRLFLRNIAMLFDGRLGKGAPRYSKTI